MLKHFLFIAFGGAIGSMFRYQLQLLVTRWLNIVFPVGTFIVNMSGCFLIGLLYGLSNRYALLTLEWRLFLITGICGGYTTFSSFSYEGISLFRQGNYLYFSLYVIMSVVLGLLATVTGVVIIKR